MRFFLKCFKFSLPLLCFIALASSLQAALPYCYERIDKENHQIHLLTFEPTGYRVIAVKADKRETVSALANQYGALAAINGGFFTEEGDPAGALKIQGKWIHLPNLPRVALGWNEHNRIPANIDRLFMQDKQKWKKYEYIVGGVPLLIKGGKIIKEYAPEKITVPSFLSEKHARTAICIKENKQWLWVVAAHSRDPAFSKVEGFTMPAWAAFLKEQGCHDAINLDGGGSSTFVLQGKVLNYPAGDKSSETGQYAERPVSDAMLVIPLASS